MGQDDRRDRTIMGPKERLRLAVQLLLLALFIWATIEAYNYRELARYMPVFAGSLGMVATVASIVTDQLRYRRGLYSATATLGEATLFRSDVQVRGWWDWPLMRALRYILWFVAFAVGLYFLPISMVGPPFVAVFYLIEAKVVWWRSLLYGAAAWLLIWVVSEQIGLVTP